MNGGRKLWLDFPFWPRRSGSGRAWDAYEYQPIAPGRASEKRKMPCACGGSIVFPRRPSEHEITAAIRTHQGTTGHEAWASRIER